MLPIACLLLRYYGERVLNFVACSLNLTADDKMQLLERIISQRNNLKRALKKGDVVRLADHHEASEHHSGVLNIFTCSKKSLEEKYGRRTLCLTDIRAVDADPNIIATAINSMFVNDEGPAVESLYVHHELSLDTNQKDTYRAYVVFDEEGIRDEALRLMQTWEAQGRPVLDSTTAIDDWRQDLSRCTVTGRVTRVETDICKVEMNHVGWCAHSIGSGGFYAPVLRKQGCESTYKHDSLAITPVREMILNETDALGNTVLHNIVIYSALNQAPGMNDQEADLLEQVYALLIQRGANQQVKNRAKLTPLATAALYNCSPKQFDIVFQEKKQTLWEFGNLAFDTYSLDNLDCLEDHSDHSPSTSMLRKMVAKMFPGQDEKNRKILLDGQRVLSICVNQKRTELITSNLVLKKLLDDRSQASPIQRT